MTPFIYADDLKKEFRCYGHFYRLSVPEMDPLPCRSVLEITSLPREAIGSQPVTPDLFCDRPQAPNLPDAIMIMMNPGSSRPLEEGDTQSLLTMPLPANFTKPLVLTQPDNTQYQIMRVMVSQQWKHVRVLNISDLRDPKSLSFIARTQTLAAHVGGTAHSLFSDIRNTECQQMLSRKPDAPILVGWGQDPGLIPLATQCLHRIQGQRIVMLPSDSHPALTAHPSPMMQKKKEEWLDAIRTVLS